MLALAIVTVVGYFGLLGLGAWRDDDPGLVVILGLMISPLVLILAAATAGA